MNMLEAIVENNHATFIQSADKQFKEEVTTENFKVVVDAIAPKLKKGFKPRYLGEMSQQGYAVHLWALTIRGDADEMLVTMSLKDGKVGGFFME